MTVLDPGLYSLLVDAGRPSARSLGVPVGGAADRGALALGNALLGNAPNSVALEITMVGPTLRAEHDVACVVFGAPFALTVSGRGDVPAGLTFTLRAGDVLKIGGTPRGARGYLCVGGGFQSPSILGSCSALEPIRQGDVLACMESQTVGRSLGVESAFPLLTVLRVVDGPQRDWFPDDDFFNSPFKVSAASNRMGLRLLGEPLLKRNAEMVSEAVAPGAVQVANDGLPIVLGVDGQTIGGYPKVAHVIRADLDLLAQLRPGTTVRFQHVTVEEAEIAAQIRAAILREWLLRLAC